MQVPAAPGGWLSGGQGNTTDSISISFQIRAAQHTQGPQQIRKVYFQKKKKSAIVLKISFFVLSKFHIAYNKASLPQTLAATGGDLASTKKAFCKVELKIIK